MSQAAGGAADGCGIAGGENGGDGKVCYFVYILKWTCLTHQPGSHTYEKGRIEPFGFQSQAVPTLPSLLLFIHKNISLVPVPFSNSPTYFAQSAPRRGGRNRTATDKNNFREADQRETMLTGKKRSTIGRGGRRRTETPRWPKRRRCETQRVRSSRPNRWKWRTSGWCVVLPLPRRQPHR